MPGAHQGRKRTKNLTGIQFDCGRELFDELYKYHLAMNPNPEEGSSLAQTARQLIQTGLANSGMDDQGRVAIKAQERLAYILCMKAFRKRVADFGAQLHLDMNEAIKSDDMMIAQLAALPLDFILNPESAPQPQPQQPYDQNDQQNFYPPPYTGDPTDG